MDKEAMKAASEEARKRLDALKAQEPKQDGEAPAEEKAPEAPAAQKPAEELDPESKAIIDELYPLPDDKAQVAAPASDQKDEMIRTLLAKVESLERRIVQPAAQEARPDATAQPAKPGLDANKLAHLQALDPVLAEAIQELQAQTMKQSEVVARALETKKTEDEARSNAEAEAFLAALQKQYPAMDVDAVIGMVVRQGPQHPGVDPKALAQAFARDNHLKNLKSQRDILAKGFQRAKQGARVARTEGAAAPKAPASDAKKPHELSLANREDRETARRMAVEMAERANKS